MSFKPLFSRSLSAAPERLHFAAHSHHLWPDASFDGQVEAWNDAARLAGKPADFYAAEIIRFDGQRVTRMEMLQMIKEHELTHRQQLFTYLRLKGLVPPTTRRRLAKTTA